jgi:tetratricopeptide (TPR) repeat protein
MWLRQYQEALNHFFLSMEFPDNLNEKEPTKPVYTRVYYFIGQSYEALGNKKQSQDYYRKAATGEVKNFSEAEYFKALALKKLGEKVEAGETINHLQKSILLFEGKRDATKLYLQSLVYEFKGDAENAALSLKKALEMNPNVIIDARINASSLNPEI